MALLMDGPPKHSEQSRTALREQALAREERLAAKLRENLRRRKTQARALSSTDTSSTDTPATDSSGADAASPALPKPPPES